MPPEAVIEGYLLGPLGYAVVAVLGALFGSFANVCIVRMPPSEVHPKGRSVAYPGSHCGSCQTPIRGYDNIPILSYLLLRGRCRHCRAQFSARYLLVEVATAMIFVALYHFALGPAFAGDPLPMALLRFLVYAAFAFVLVVITFIDLDHKLILDKITYPAIPLFYLLGLTLPEQGLWDGVIGAAVGYGIVRAISDGYYFLTKREGMGYGDGKLLALVGALLGWQGVLASLFIGSILGSVIGVSAIAYARARARRRAAAPDGKGDGEADDTALRHVELPFGPFLAAAALVYLFVSPLGQLAPGGWRLP
jgi:leader peptidase (prepilin peptidase) / N-methyltransferase